MNGSKSPWSAYGRWQGGTAREAMRTHEQVKRYLERTLREYHEIRAGSTGYIRIIADALKPVPKRESIEEALRRLSGTRASDLNPGRSDPSSTV